MASDSRTRQWWATTSVVALGTVLAVSAGSYGHWHESTGAPISTFGFASVLEMKAWLTSGAAMLALVQAFTAAGMWGRVPGVRASSVWVAPVHRWSGTAAFLLVLPVAYHCLWSLGYQTYSTRVAVHSVLGCAFFGLFSAKMLALRLRGLPGFVLPLLGGGLAGVLAVVWATSSYWYFTTLA